MNENELKEMICGASLTQLRSIQSLVNEVIEVRQARAQQEAWKAFAEAFSNYVDNFGAIELAFPDDAGDTCTVELDCTTELPLGYIRVI